MSELALKKSSSLLISSASKAWNFLHGTINVYKPAGVSTHQVMSSLKINICRDLNSMELEEPVPLVQIESEDNKKFHMELVPNLAQHVLVTGPRYITDHLKIAPADHLGMNTSGVMILGINKGTRFSYALRNGAPIQTFHLTGKFGKQTENNFTGSLVKSKASYGHVTFGKLSSLLSSMQATYQRQMYDMSGVDIQSQAAYELACKGVIRPANAKGPVIYGIKCTDYYRPKFTIEVQTMNASEKYLCGLIYDIGLHMRTVAHCTAIRCVRYGYFTYEDSLLRSQWNLQNVITSMHECQKVWKKYPSMVSEENHAPVGYKQDSSQKIDEEMSAHLELNRSEA